MTDIILPNVNTANRIARQFNLQNVQILRPQRKEFTLPGSANTPDEELYRSYLNTPVLINLTFQGTTYIDENGVSHSFNDFTLDTVLLSLTQSKNIVKTAIQGRKGTVKEYVGMGDYNVTIYGLLCGTNGAYPKNEVQVLKNIVSCTTAITVTSWFLQMFDINSIVIDDYDISQDEGGYSRQPFNIFASSDEQINLRYQ